MKTKSQVKHIIITFSIIITVILLVNKFHIIKMLNLHHIVKCVERNGKTASITFLLLILLKSFVIFLPSSVFSVAGGILFGPVKGFILNMIGFFISGTLVFCLTRFLGKSYVDKVAKGKLIKLDKNIESNGFKLLFLLRLPPIIPYDILSIAAAMTNVQYSKFILASLLGVIPETLCYSFLGMSIGENSYIKITMTLLLMVITLLITLFIYNKGSNSIKINQDQSM